jgi:hypothetical protein
MTIGFPGIGRRSLRNGNDGGDCGLGSNVDWDENSEEAVEMLPVIMIGRAVP